MRSQLSFEPHPFMVVVIMIWSLFIYLFNYFIECFTTTFLRAHSWLNWVDDDDDEDEVGLKEKPEDTRNNDME